MFIWGLPCLFKIKREPCHLYELVLAVPGVWLSPLSRLLAAGLPGPAHCLSPGLCRIRPYHGPLRMYPLYPQPLPGPDDDCAADRYVGLGYGGDKSAITSDSSVQLTISQLAKSCGFFTHPMSLLLKTTGIYSGEVNSI